MALDSLITNASEPIEMVLSDARCTHSTAPTKAECVTDLIQFLVQQRLRTAR